MSYTSLLERPVWLAGGRLTAGGRPVGCRRRTDAHKNVTGSGAPLPPPLYPPAWCFSGTKLLVNLPRTKYLRLACGLH